MNVRQINALRGMIRLGMIVCCIGSSFLRAEHADRLLVGVNGSVITEGDLYIARRLNDIIYPGRPANQASREEEIDRRINLELIRQELNNLHLEIEDESPVQARLEAVVQKYEGSGGLAGILEASGISEEELYSYLKLEVLTARFLDFRFRAFVRVERKEIEDYYRERLQPQLRESGIDVPPLEEVSKKIEEILMEEKISEELDLWIEIAHSNARIEYFLDDTLRSPEKGPELR